MDMPDVFYKPSGPLRGPSGQEELHRSDTFSLPFLDWTDAGARSLVFGEVTGDLLTYLEVAAEMFLGYQDDPGE